MVGSTPEASGRQVVGRSARQRRYDAVTVLLLMVGGLVVPFVGWLVGAVMLWAGPRWTPRQKVLGTLVWPLGPGGLVLVSLLPTVTEVCSKGPQDPTPVCTRSGWSMPSWLGLPTLAVGVGVGVAVGLFLAARARRYDRWPRVRRGTGLLRGWPGNAGGQR